LAEQVTGLDTTTLVKASRVELADSALHAPQAGFGRGFDSSVTSVARSTVSLVVRQVAIADRLNRVDC
jgi:hypothetical protein